MINKHFDQSTIEVPSTIECSLLKACNRDLHGETDDEPLVPPAVEKLYAKDLDIKRLQRQMQILPDLVRSCPEIAKEVARVRTLANLLATAPLASSMFSKIEKLDRMYLTMPLTTATGERSFSALTRIKTYFRSSMTQQHLNNAMFLSIHKVDTDALDLKRIAQQFVNVDKCHRRFFGNKH